jgi:hypothetical protein
MTLMPLIFPFLKYMVCGIHTSGPSSTSEQPDMATRGALRRCRRSLVAHRRGTAASSPSGELAHAALAGARPHPSPVGLWELDPPAAPPA